MSNSQSQLDAAVPGQLDEQALPLRVVSKAHVSYRDDGDSVSLTLTPPGDGSVAGLREAAIAPSLFNWAIIGSIHFSSARATPFVTLRTGETVEADLSSLPVTLRSPRAWPNDSRARTSYASVLRRVMATVVQPTPPGRAASERTDLGPDGSSTTWQPISDSLVVAARRVLVHPGSTGGSRRTVSIQLLNTRIVPRANP
jgi:hypothetical protein